MEYVTSLIFAAVPSLLLGAGILGLGMGTALLIFPRGIQRLGQTLNRWRSTRRVSGPLERPFVTEKFIYRHNRLFGAFLMAGGAFACLRVGSLMAAGSAALLRLEPFREGLMDASLIFLLLGNAAAMVIGAVVFSRPSRLKGVEAQANQWVSTRRALHQLETMDERIDRYVLAHPRMTGIILVLASLYLFASATTINLV